VSARKTFGEVHVTQAGAREHRVISRKVSSQYRA
jgi:hypothetical protein